MKKLVILSSVEFSILLLLTLLTQGLTAQTQYLNSCGFDTWHKSILKKDSEYRNRYLNYEKSLLEQREIDIISRENPSYTLPVVVHIIHNGGVENISDEEVQRGIDNLNEAYANIGYYNPSTGVKTGVQFCLAQRNPDGEFTTGITRTKSPLTNVEMNSQDENLKNLVRWDPAHYINIWLVKQICSGKNCSVIGYALFPAAHGTKRDGLVVEAAYFAKTKASSCVQIHEMGHYLGLYHTFQGGCKNDNCKIDGDKVCDTPPDASTARVKCGEDFNSCTTDTDSGFKTDQNDMYWDYMDYGDLKCYSAFTEGQRQRMIFTIQNIRNSLLDSKACISPCPVDITADFTVQKDTILIGETISFNNASSPNASTFSWEIEGKTITTDKNMTYQFKETGSFTITLKVYNNDKTCYDFINKTITVICGAEAGIEIDKTAVFSGESVHFKSKISGASFNYKWYIKKSLIGTEQQIDHTFKEEGAHTVKLIVNNTQWNCTDTAEITIIVTCPVQPIFSSSTFFPAVDSLVTFSNTSINANAYKWKINGQVVSNSKNLTHVFTTPGENTVCLEAQNDNCVKEFCMQIFVLSEDTVSCEDVYFKKIGDPYVNETCSDFSFLPGGKIAIVGSYNNKSLLVVLDNNLKVKYTQSFDFLKDAEYVYKSFIDKDGFLIISGMEFLNSNGRSMYILKYNIQTNTIIWKKQISYISVNYPTVRTISQLPNGNYLIGGQTYVEGCDAIILEINKSNGNIVWQNIYNTGSCEVFRNLLYKDNFIYGIGRFDMYRASTGKFRNILMKMDNHGKVIWTKNYLFPKSKSSRIYGFDMIFDNGLVFISLGDETGSNLDNSKIQMIKTDVDGNILFAKGFYIENSKYNRAIDILNLPDGYLISGNYKYSGDNRKLFLFKTNKKGELIWSKSYKVGTSCGDSRLKYKNGLLYYMGTSINGNDKDIFILKLDIDGNLIVDCDIENINLKVNIKDFSFFSESISVDYINHNIPYQDFTYKSYTPDLVEVNLCKKDCIDTCLIAPDGSLVALNSRCKLDSFILYFEVCNHGNSTIPIGAPVTFYKENPISRNSTPLGTYNIPDSIAPNDCNQYHYTIHSTGNTSIYAFFNDNGSSITPFTPDRDLPNTGIIECNWENNLGYWELRNAKTNILDLGEDTTMCVSGIVNLNAGAGFVSYKWNDGSSDSIFTAWNPGKYWVEVTDLCGNIQRDTVNISIDSALIIDLGEDMIICPGEEISFEVPGFEKYRWEPSRIFDCNDCSKVVFKPDSSVKVIVTAQNDNGCYSNDTITILVPDKIDITLPQDTSIYLGDKIIIRPIGLDRYKYNWTPSDGLSCIDCFSPEAMPLKTTLYTLEITDEYGCSATDDILIEVKNDIIIYIPNAFTPNDDGVNDKFIIRGKKNGINRILSFRIYDRWGELIFEDSDFQINDPLHGWNGTYKGKKMPSDVFVYVVSFELVDNSILTKKGDVTLLR